MKYEENKKNILVKKLDIRILIASNPSLQKQKFPWIFLQIYVQWLENLYKSKNLGNDCTIYSVLT